MDLGFPIYGTSFLEMKAGSNFLGIYFQKLGENKKWTPRGDITRTKFMIDLKYSVSSQAQNSFNFMQFFMEPKTTLF